MPKTEKAKSKERLLVITDDIRVGKDQRQYVVYRRKVVNGTDIWNPIRYYTTPVGLVEGLIRLLGHFDGIEKLDPSGVKASLDRGIGILTDAILDPKILGPISSSHGADATISKKEG